MVTYEKIKSRFSRNWSLRDRGRHFASASVYFFSLLVITAVNRSSAVAWLLMPEHLIGWFLISFGKEFVIGMAFGKKGKIFKNSLWNFYCERHSTIAWRFTHQCVYFLYGLALLIGGLSFL